MARDCIYQKVHIMFNVRMAGETTAHRWGAGLRVRASTSAVGMVPAVILMGSRDAKETGVYGYKQVVKGGSTIKPGRPLLESLAWRGTTRWRTGTSHENQRYPAVYDLA